MPELTLIVDVGACDVKVGIDNALEDGADMNKIIMKIPRESTCSREVL